MIEQIAVDCSATLTDPGLTSFTTSIDYSSDATPLVIGPQEGGTTWEAQLANTDTTNCPVTSVTLYNANECGLTE